MKTDEAIEAVMGDFRFQDLGEIAYNAAWNPAGGSLKPWAELPEQIQVAWLMVGLDVATVMGERLYDVAKKIDQLSGGVNG